MKVADKFEVIDPSGRVIARIPSNRIHMNMIVRNRGALYVIHSILSDSKLAEAILVID